MKKKGEIFSENGKNINKNSFRLRQCAQARKTQKNYFIDFSFLTILPLKVGLLVSEKYIVRND